VVEVGTASSIEDTARVELEGHLVSLDGDGDGTSSANGGFQSILVTAGDIGVLGHSGGRLASLLASALNTLVRVGGLLADAVLDDPLEGVVHQTTVAAHVARRASAINQLLLREADQLAVLGEVGTLDGTSGGESPAAAALALVLDGGDSALGDPVNGIGNGGHIDVGLVLGADEVALDGHEAEVLGLELLLSQIGELVDAHGVRVVALVVLSDGIEVGLEDVVASEELLVLVGFGELGDEPGKGGLVFGFGQGLGANGSSKQQGKSGDAHRL